VIIYKNILQKDRMMTYDLQEIKRLTGWSVERRNELMRYYGKLPEDLRLNVMERQRNLIWKNSKKQKRKDKEIEFFYGMLLRAVHQLRRLETTEQRKQTLTDEEIAKIETIRRNRIKTTHRKKKSPLKKVIEIQLYELIKRLRSDGLSWRDISAYIARYHKRRISHAYIAAAYKTISAEREKSNAADKY
jgi:hypothetical protein